MLTEFEHALRALLPSSLPSPLCPPHLHPIPSTTNPPQPLPAALSPAVSFPRVSPKGSSIKSTVQKKEGEGCKRYTTLT